MLGVGGSAQGIADTVQSIRDGDGWGVVKNLALTTVNVVGTVVGGSGLLKELKTASKEAKAAEAAAAEAKEVASSATSVSVQRTTPAVADGSFYSVAIEIRLSPTSYPGLSRGAHFKEANESLLRIMEGDSSIAQSMRDMGIALERTPTALAPSRPPPGWTWHHAQEPGFMQLVPRPQHTPGSIFWDTLHPDGQGGYAIWGK